MITQHPNIISIKFSKDFDKPEPIDLTQAANAGNDLAIEIQRKQASDLDMPSSTTPHDGYSNL